MKPYLQGMLRYKVFIILIIALVILAGSAIAFDQHIENMSKQVTINDNGYEVDIITMEDTVDDILNKYNIELGPWDEVQPAKDVKLEKHTDITINRAIEVKVMADGEIKTVHLVRGKVKDVLSQAGVTMGEDDIISHDPEANIVPGLFITLNRVQKETIVEKATIPFKTIQKDNASLEVGTKKVAQEGKEGQLEKTISIVYKDGKEISRELVEEKVVIQSIDKVIQNGTKKKPVVVASRGSSVSRSKDAAPASTKAPAAKASVDKAASSSSNETGKATSVFQATAYTHTGNRTATGVWPKIGMIAVDPKVIKLRTQVYVEFPKGWEHLSGYYQAMDTGGGIKGNRIDVFMDTERQCINFGRRNVKIRLDK